MTSSEPMPAVPRSITVRLPGRVTTAGEGRVALPFGVETMEDRPGEAFRYDPVRFRGVVWVEGLHEQDGCCVRTKLDDNGKATLVLPGDVSGRLAVRLELEDRPLAEPLRAVVELVIGRTESRALKIDLSGTHVEGSGVVYAPVEVHGAGEVADCAVGEDRLVRLPLRPAAIRGRVTLAALLEREACVPLWTGESHLVPVFQLWAGQPLVVGRAFRSQLHGGPLLRRFERLGARRVGWVTRWGDTAVSRMSCALGLAGDPLCVSVENLTDYGRTGQHLAVRSPGEAGHVVEPGKSAKIPFESGKEIVVARTGGGLERAVIRGVLETLPLDLGAGGRVWVPLVRTKGLTFPADPEDPAGPEIRHLGVWFPWPVAQLERTLKLSGDSLTVRFPGERFSIRFWFDEAQRAIVAGSAWIDLRKAVEGS